MPPESALRLLDSLRSHEVDACLGGGWAVDALLGLQTREHSDLDLWVEAGDAETLFIALAEHHVDRVFPWPGDRPWNFVLHDGRSLRVDLHFFEPLPDGRWHYGSALGGEVLPLEALSGRGSILGNDIRCEAPEWSVRFHGGYPPRPVDHLDVARLCERFAIPMPEGFAPPRHPHP
jgi:lincosamide nucleotidyltransferase A/C/D/E